MWLLRAQGVADPKDTKTTSLRQGGCLVSGFGKKEDAESQAKLKMDGHQDMETTTSKGEKKLK